MCKYHFWKFEMKLYQSGAELLKLDIQMDTQFIGTHKNKLLVPCQFYNPSHVLLETRLKLGPQLSSKPTLSKVVLH